MEKNQTVERIKENIQSIDYFVDELKEEIEYVDLWRNEYLRRIDKAIEYVNTWMVDEYSIGVPDKEDPDTACVYEPKAIDNLLNILQGSDK